MSARKPLIYLYVPISRSREHRKLERSALSRAKAFLLQARDRFAWNFLRSHMFDYHAWCHTEYTNRGDIAIREAISQLLRQRLGDRARFVELDWGGLQSTLARINAEADLFVICGGGYVSADATTGKLSRVMDDVSALARVKCPVVAFGIGYNCVLEQPPGGMIRTLPAETSGKIRALVAACELIATRDEVLLGLIGEAGGTPAALIGDPALFLNSAAGSPARERSAGDARLRVGLNFALHGPISAGIFRKHFEVYAEFLRRLQRERSVAFSYFMHCETEQIVVSLLRRRGIIVEVVDAEPQEMVAAYQRMDVVVCQMLHASILATNAGVPSMSIAYDVKNLSFCRLMGLTEFCLPHDEVSVEALNGLFVNLVDRKDELAAVLQKRKTELRAATDGFVDRVVGLLDRSPSGAPPGGPETSPLDADP